MAITLGVMAVRTPLRSYDGVLDFRHALGGKGANYRDLRALALFLAASLFFRFSFTEGFS
jgi:hypothetical protein